MINQDCLSKMARVEPSKPGEEDGTGIFQPRLLDGQAEA